MKPLFRRGALVLAIFGAGAGLWWVLQDTEAPAVPNAIAALLLNLRNLRSFIVRKNGVPLREIAARHVTLAADGSSTVATGVEKGILFRDGKPFLRLAAPRVRLDSPSNDLGADGGVRASGPDGFSVETARMRWHHLARQLECPSPVKAWVRDLVFQTARLGYDTTSGVFKCPEKVQVSAPGVSLSSARLAVHVKTRVVKLQGGVELVIDPRVARPPVAGSQTPGLSDSVVKSLLPSP